MKFLPYLIILLVSQQLFSQQIHGKTVDEKGQPIPFATVQIKGTTKGTTSNGQGNYFLKLPIGNHSIVVQHIGFQKVESIIEVTDVHQLDFVLKPEILALDEVVVTSSEDPAYRVIREAIKKRKHYREEIKAYSCDVYIKGLQRLDTFPDKILGIKLTLDTGIVYLSESISKLKFMQPNYISERMISSKVSGDNRAFSWNQASDMIINMYDNTFDIAGLSERKFVSPIANNAFLFYDYELVGVFQEDDLLINKIKLLPKRKTDPVFDGYIYIVEHQWRVHSVDALIVKSRGIEFVDSLTLKQSFTRMSNDLWMPFSQRFGFQFNAFKIKGSGYFNAVYSNYEVEPNIEPEGESEKEEAVQPLFTKKDFTNEIMYVEEGSNEKDSIYWEEVRPIPLSGIEIADYHVKDSIRIVKESKPYMDSVDTERNKLTLGKLFLSGYTYHKSYDEKLFAFPTVLTSFQYNTVEGAVTDLGFSYWKNEDNRLKYRISPSVRYGFSNEKFHAKTTFWYRALDQKFTSFMGGAGRYVSQLNESDPVGAFSNSLSALFFGWSPTKLFEKGFLYGEFRQELFNGFFMMANLEYSNRSQLFNTSSYTWADVVRFDSNTPTNAEIGNTSFPLHQALVLDLRFRIRFNQKYQTRPDRKITYKSKSPDFWIRYKKGINALGSDVNYDMLELFAEDELDFGLVGKSEWNVAVGGFLNDHRMSFIDFKHFNGNTLFYSREMGSRQFQLLDYYQFSTKSSYLEGHFEHHFNEFIFNKIPVVRNFNWQAVASAHYLRTKASGDYMEVGAGVEHIFKFMRVDYFRAISNGRLQPYVANQAIRIGVGF